MWYTGTVECRTGKGYTVLFDDKERMEGLRRKELALLVPLQGRPGQVVAVVGTATTGTIVRRLADRPWVRGTPEPQYVVTVGLCTTSTAAAATTSAAA